MVAHERGPWARCVAKRIPRSCTKGEMLWQWASGVVQSASGVVGMRLSAARKGELHGVEYGLKPLRLHGRSFKPVSSSRARLGGEGWIWLSKTAASMSRWALRCGDEQASIGGGREMRGLSEARQ